MPFFRINRAPHEAAAADKFLNADVNGAINIMRKYIYKAHSELSGALDSFIRDLPFSRVCNPLIDGKNGCDVLRQDQRSQGCVTPSKRNSK